MPAWVNDRAGLNEWVLSADRAEQAKWLREDMPASRGAHPTAPLWDL